MRKYILPITTILICILACIFLRPYKVIYYGDKMQLGWKFSRRFMKTEFIHTSSDQQALIESYEREAIHNSIYPDKYQEENYEIINEWVIFDHNNKMVTGKIPEEVRQRIRNFVSNEKK